MSVYSQHDRSCDPCALPGVPLLLCHDLVEAGAETEELASWRTCIHNSGLLLGEARRRNWLIAHAFRDGFALEPVKAVRPLPDEPVFQYKGLSAFSSKGLRSFMTVNPSSAILLVGRSSLQMCLATDVSDADIGSPLSVISDATSLSKQAVQRHPQRDAETTNELLPVFVSITTTSQVLRLEASLSLLN
jgi:hypothetical protein